MSCDVTCTCSRNGRVYIGPPLRVVLHRHTARGGR
jgi:hypothetical protein